MRLGDFPFIGGHSVPFHPVVRFRHLDHTAKTSDRNISIMPFSRKKFDDIQRAIRLALVSTELNAWERGFLREIQAKLNRYGLRTTLTDKQYKQLMKLTQKYAEPKQKISQIYQLPRESRFVKRETFSRRWRPAIGLAIAVVALGFGATYKGAERFPEYFTPVVAISSSQEIVGRVTHVRDGDTIEVSGVPIRFGSLDCAESGTNAGERATARMRTLVAGQTLTCFLNGRTSYDRKIGSCRLQGGRDLGAIMIREGYCSRFW